ncbi:MAG: hypothetical protein Q7O66_00685, partial [Dehalococcoidia bacterium]|nr:hypothetical protein [Dehalococcoidia bacterium]
MTTFDQILARFEGELQRYSLALALEFRKAAEATRPNLTLEQLEAWSSEGLAIARNSFRSWEAAAEFFKASAAIARQLGFPTLMAWAACGRDLSSCSASIASSFFGSSPDALGLIAPSDIDIWVKSGRSLYKETWKTGLLCGQFFATSPVLLRHLSV